MTSNPLEHNVCVFELSAQVSQKRLMAVGKLLPLEAGTRLCYSLRDIDSGMTISFYVFNDEDVDTDKKKYDKGVLIKSYFSKGERCGRMGWLTQDMATVMALDIAAR